MLPKSGIRILELPTDRRRDASVRKELYAAAATFDDNVESSPPSD